MCRKPHGSPALLAPIASPFAWRLRRKAVLVLAVSTLGVVAPATLLAGVDLSAWAPGRAPVDALPGDHVLLALRAWDENGTLVLDEPALDATLGAGGLVPGLDAALTGLHAGQSFNVTLPPEQAYGAWNASLVQPLPRYESFNRLFRVSYAAFDAQEGPPSVGERVPASPWNATVVAVGQAVTLRYDPAVGDEVRLYQHWRDRVAGLTNDTIRVEHELAVGDNFTLRRARPPDLVVRVVAAGPDSFTLDANPVLAGHTLRFAGTVLQVRVGSALHRQAGVPTSTAAQSCEGCHAGVFQAFDASVSAERMPDGVHVNLTIADPWLHDVQGLHADVTELNGSRVLGRAGSAVPDIARDGTTHADLVLPLPEGNATVQVTLNATAHHRHASGGKPDDLPYTLTVSVPVGSARAARLAGAGATLIDWGLAGRVTGFLALGLAFAPAWQGWRRHRKLPARVRRPAWLTSHTAMSLLALALTVVHAETLMSSPAYRGAWTWGVNAGTLALLLLAAMGFSGVLLAGWMPRRWPRARRVHYVLMLLVMATAVLHTLASGSTLRALLGA